LLIEMFPNLSQPIVRTLNENRTSPTFRDSLPGGAGSTEPIGDGRSDCPWGGGLISGSGSVVVDARVGGTALPEERSASTPATVTSATTAPMMTHVVMRVLRKKLPLRPSFLCARPTYNPCSAPSPLRIVRYESERKDI